MGAARAEASRGGGAGAARLLLVTGLTGAVGCGTPDEPMLGLPSYVVALRAGDGQAGPAGGVLAQPLAVLVTDSAGSPVRGVPVRFRIVGGRGGVLLDSVAVTDPDGIALARLRVGAERDSVTVLAAVPGREAGGVRFTAVATPGPALVALQPALVAAGDTVTLRGRRLGGAAETTVLFGGVRARVVGVGGDSIARVVVPHCLGPGQIEVTARVGSATTNPVFATAADGTRPLALPAFEAATVFGTDASGCLRLAGNGVRYLVIPQFAATDTVPLSRAFALGLDGALTAAGTAGALADRAPSPARTTGGEGADDTPRAALERTLRAAESRLARAGLTARTAGEIGPVLGRAAPQPPALGSERPFRVLARLDGTTYATVTARLRWAGTHVLLYEDRNAPAPLADGDALRLGEFVDRTIQPLVVEQFGSESDLDANGRVMLLVTPVVNTLTPASRCGSDAFVGGFFNGADLDVRNPNGNRAEVLYLLAPDPQGVRSCPQPSGDVLRQLPVTVAHELQHLVSFNQHVLVRRGPEESPWLNEALSHLAEERVAALFEARYPGAAGRATPGQLLPDSAVPFLRANVEHALLWLGATTAASTSTFRDTGTLEERGAAWLFLRWMVAQRGPAILPRLVQSAASGRRNVEDVMGEPFGALLADFSVALAADTVPGVPRARIPARYRFGERALRDLLTRALGRPTRWPLVAKSAPALGGAALGSMVQGTFDLYDVTAAGGRPLVVRFGPAAGGVFPPNAQAQVTVFRVSP